MSNKNGIIIVITEGAISKGINEVNFVKKYLVPLYLSEIEVEIYSYGTNIYQLYMELQGEDDEDDKFLDVYPTLKNCVVDKNNKSLEYERDDISDIYLFFDLDAHDNTFPFDDRLKIISDMIEFFDNSTDNGLLCISYPMFEAYKHPIHNKAIIDIFINEKYKNYKNYVSMICEKQLNQIQKFTKLEWDQLLINHLININDFIFDNNQLPISYSEDDFTQDKIYQNQLEKHISPNQQVRVISPFCLFLLDFLGNPLLEEWKTISPSSSISPTLT